MVRLHTSGATFRLVAISRVVGCLRGDNDKLGPHQVAVDARRFNPWCSVCEVHRHSRKLLAAQAMGALEYDASRAECTAECRRARPVEPLVGDYSDGDFAYRLDDVWCELRCGHRPCKLSRGVAAHPSAKRPSFRKLTLIALRISVSAALQLPRVQPVVRASAPIPALTPLQLLPLQPPCDGMLTDRPAAASRMQGGFALVSKLQGSGSEAAIQAVFTGTVINALLIFICGAFVVGWILWIFEHNVNKNFTFTSSAYWAIVVRD